MAPSMEVADQGTGSMKRGASEACGSCQAKQVKCSVVTSGIPCHNCLLDKVECSVGESKRRKIFGDEGLIPSPLPASPSQQLGDLHDKDSRIDGVLAKAPMSIDFDLDEHPPNIGQPIQEPRGSSVNRRSSSHLDLLMNSNEPQLPSRTESRAGAALPSYIRPCPNTLSVEDAEFLRRKGALTVPQDRLRDELIHSYVQFVHPYLPIIELRDFLETIYCNDGSTKISLMMFQGIMFTGSAFVDINLLKMAGFDDRKTARKVLFDRVKLLYDFDYDLDRMSMIQTLLLMTYWLENPNDNNMKDLWYWLGVALDAANIIGLHRNDILLQTDLKLQKLRKRVWWACFMRDRLIALSIRKPIRIKDQYHDIPMLVLEDFDIQPLSQRYYEISGDTAREDVARRMTLANLCIEKTRLCLCIGHVLSTQYSVFGSKFETTTEVSMMLTPKGPNSTADHLDFIACEQELSQWHESLPEDCSYKSSALQKQEATPDCRVLFLHRALLSMLYSTTISALHRPQVLPELPSQPMARNLQQLSRRRVKEAAANIADVAADLQNYDLVRFLPPVGVTVLIPAMIVHLLDMKSEKQVVRSVCSRRFLHCIQALQRLREIYPSADATFLFLEAFFWKVFSNDQTSPQATPTSSRSMIDWLNQNILTLQGETYAIEPFQIGSMHHGDRPARSDSLPLPAEGDFGYGDTNIVAAAGEAKHAVPENGARTDDEFGAWIDLDMWPNLSTVDDGEAADIDLDGAIWFA